MSINFTLSDEQRKLQHEVRSFAENVLAPVVAEADREPDPVTAVQRTKPAYVQAYKAGIAMCMLPGSTAAAGCRAWTWCSPRRRSAWSTQASPAPSCAMGSG